MNLPLLLLIVVGILGAIKVYRLDWTPTYVGSVGAFGCMIYVVIMLILTLLIGGIYWW